MSLAEKWKDYRATLQLRSDEQERLLREAFYAGAEAALNESILSEGETQSWAEIEYFRSHK